MRPKSVFELALVWLFHWSPVLVAGGLVFAVLTPLLYVFDSGGNGVKRSVIFTMLLVVAALLVVPFVRAFALGFLGALVIATIPQRGFYTRIWVEPVAHYVGVATAPIRMSMRRSREQRAWLARWRDTPLPIDAGIFRARQLQSDVVRKVLAQRTQPGVPSAMELTEPDDYRGFRNDALDIPMVWPHRFSERGDQGWRWTLSASNTPSRWGGPGFLISFRPEPLLGRAGPILELDGQDLLRISDSSSAPWRIARTPIPAMQRVRECLLAAGAMIPDDLQRWTNLPNATETRRACRDVSITVSGTVEREGTQELQVSFKEPDGSAQVWSRPISMGCTVLGPGLFELHGAEHFRRYLLAADSTLHVTTEDRPARTTDTPPLACEIDPKINCE